MDLSQYGILNPLGLVTLAALVGVACLTYRAIRITLRLYTDLQLPTPPSSFARNVLTFSTALLLALAIMRPYWGAEDIKVSSRGDDVVFLVDISRSMYATDVPPSRLEVAKRKIKDLVAHLSQNGAAVRFGITVFAGDGYTVCPITTDRGVLAQFVETISPDLVSSLGSNITSGIEAALSRFDDTAKSHSRVILLSDGEDNFFDAAKVVSEIHAKGVRFDVLGVGTVQGSTIQLTNGATLLDRTRQPIISVLKESALEAIARAGGGLYVRASLDDSDIIALSSPRLMIGQDRRTIQDTLIRSYRELGPWICVAALVALVFSNFIKGSNPLASILISLFLLGYTPLCSAQAATPVPRPPEQLSPFTLYQQGNYQAAAEGFAQALSRNPSDKASKQGLASSLYRLGNYGESEQLFKELAENATNGRHYYEAVYNQGNAQLKSKRYRDAIDSFLKALDVKPEDEQASHNLSVARALLEEEKRRALEPTPTPTVTPTATPTSQAESSPQQSPSPSPQPSQAATPSPVPSPESTDSAEQPSPTPAAEGSAQPTSVSESSTPSQATQTAEANATSEHATQAPTRATDSQATPSDERRKEADEKEADPTTASAPQPSASPESSSFPEVDAWLESLPESPLLIRRHRGSQPPNGQTW
jgi:Ca-activated chloride channel family protein